MFKTILNCLVCDSTQLANVITLVEQAFNYVLTHSFSENISSGNVDLVKCSSAERCGLVQLKQSYDLSQIYGPLWLLLGDECQHD
jgi:hypothetical protein